MPAMPIRKTPIKIFIIGCAVIVTSAILIVFFLSTTNGSNFDIPDGFYVASGHDYFEFVRVDGNRIEFGPSPGDRVRFTRSFEYTINNRNELVLRNGLNYSESGIVSANTTDWDGYFFVNEVDGDVLVIRFGFALLRYIRVR
jgi:hypothetical protein